MKVKYYTEYKERDNQQTERGIGHANITTCTCVLSAPVFAWRHCPIFHLPSVCSHLKWRVPFCQNQEGDRGNFRSKFRQHENVVPLEYT
jgi:hypothetical protein